MLGFAGAFLADALRANSTYDALAAHRVALTGHVVGCFDIQTGRTGASYGAEVCRLDYSYKGQNFSSVIGFNQPKVFYVDPLDTSYRMDKATFSNGPVEVTGDIVFFVLLILGAILVTTAHQIHLYQRRKRQHTAQTHVLNSGHHPLTSPF
jgi:hypothetical protein